MHRDRDRQISQRQETNIQLKTIRPKSQHQDLAMKLVSDNHALYPTQRHT